MLQKAPGIRPISCSGGNLLRATLRHSEVVPKSRVVVRYLLGQRIRPSCQLHREPKACMISKTNSTHHPTSPSFVLAPFGPHRPQSTVQKNDQFTFTPFAPSTLQARSWLPPTHLCRGTRDLSEPSAFLFMCTALLLHHNRYVRPLRPALVWRFSPFQALSMF